MLKKVAQARRGHSFDLGAADNCCWSTTAPIGHLTLWRLRSRQLRRPRTCWKVSTSPLR